MSAKRKSPDEQKSSQNGNFLLDPLNNQQHSAMRIIAVRTLRKFWAQNADAEQALKSWYKETSNSRWLEPNDVKRRYPSADIIPGNRIVFNIKGNTYRLIVKIHYNTGIVFIRFVGTHAEYDKIDANTI